MPNPFLTDTRTTRQEPPGHEGIVTRAPANVDGQLFVKIPTFSTQHEYGPCVWQPKGTSLPQVGERCLVIFDSDSEPWVPIWEGGFALGGAGTDLSAAHYYSTLLSTGTGNTLSIPQATHGLRATAGIQVQVQDSSGTVVSTDVNVSPSGDVTITFAQSQGAALWRITLTG